MANFKRSDLVTVYVAPAPNVPGKRNVEVEVTRNGKLFKRGRVASNVSPIVAIKVAKEAKRKLAGQLDTPVKVKNAKAFD